MKIAILAGHGGSDSGAVDPIEKEQNDGIYQDDIYTEESDVNLKAAKILEKILTNNGHEVFMARDRDVYISLQNRTHFANDNNADIVISLHANAAANSAAEGIETLHYPGSENGQKLANNVQKRMIKASNATDRGIKERDNLYVLRKTLMPAVLVEMGFLTNPKEEHLLNEREYLYLLMEAVAAGVDDYERE
ncbi:N-acetylmuramoyl-L-alanine amidase family protein [Halanaerobium salsuginis]|uniref:N-acetylmuramoyl-L-alanine amidase n=1 Tax=Halanaerobium salsuginis TaxID=29563 RepID=A0A1I4LQN1_9FIRM|nr:N-acetylmuramoyl-L-alanine amidase [Halanaerobium salsuginis]SFL93314.1 N-acetylmuramoyl-L-alanine amidase [Halanaerobium salsuginis]